jgi:hypothetical protein
MSVTIGTSLHPADFTFADIEFHVLNHINAPLTLNTSKSIFGFAMSGVTGTNAAGYGLGSLTGSVLENRQYSLNQSSNTVLYDGSRTVLRSVEGTGTFDLQGRFDGLENLNSLHTPSPTLILYMVPLVERSDYGPQGIIVDDLPPFGGPFTTIYPIDATIKIRYLGHLGQLYYYHVGSFTCNINIDAGVTSKIFLVDEQFEGNAGKVYSAFLNGSMYCYNSGKSLNLCIKDSQATKTLTPFGAGKVTYIVNPALPSRATDGGTIDGRGKGLGGQNQRADGSGTQAQRGKGYGAGATFYRPLGGGYSEGGGGGFDLQDYSNVPGVNALTHPDPPAPSFQFFGACLLIAISPPVRNSDAEVSSNGIPLYRRSNVRGKNIYIINGAGPLAFNTTKPITIYYIGAGGKGGKSSEPGSYLAAQNTTTYYNAVGNAYYRLPFDVRPDQTFRQEDNLLLTGGGAGAAGGGGGGSGAVGKITLTSIKYLHCNISSTGTEVFTEDRYLGMATSGSNGTNSIKTSGMNATTDGSNPPVYRGGSSTNYDGNTLASGIPGQQGTGGILINSYIGTTGYTGSAGSNGGVGGRGQSEGFLAEQPSGRPPPRVIEDDAQPGSQGGPRNGAGGSNSSNNFFFPYWDGFYLLNQTKSASAVLGGSMNGQPGLPGKTIGFGGGEGGEGGLGGLGLQSLFPHPRIGARGAGGGGGGGGGAGAPGFSLDKDLGLQPFTLDTLGSTYGCVILVIG